MAVKNTKIGAILGLIGSVLLLITGLTALTMARNIYYEPSYPTFIWYIIAGVTVAFSTGGIVGTVMVIRDNPLGYYYLLIAGIGGIVGTFVPIYNWDSGYGYIQTFYLSNTFGFVDLVLMIVGGILGFALAEKKGRNADN